MDIRALQLVACPEGTQLPIYVQPGASRDEVVGVHDGALKVRIAAPPKEGAANEHCRKYLARTLLRCPTSKVSLMHGARSRQKLFLIEGISPEEVRTCLEASL